MLSLSIDFNMMLSLAIALMVSYIMIPPVVGISKAKKLVAMPNGRTSHDGAIPTIGGVAIFASVFVAAGLCIPKNYPTELQFLVPALIILFFVGIQDDMVGINPRKKLIGQIAASLIVITLANVRMGTLHGLLGIHEIPYGVGVAISLIMFIGIINAFNLVDGIDGLASGLGIIIALVFGIWLSMLGHEHYAVLSFALAGSLIAFYRFNVFSKKYKIFMGDTGSMLIGFIFAILVVKVLCCEVPAESFLHMNAFPVVAISLMIFPISDTLRVMVRRIFRGRFPYSADRTHCHHDLLRLGFSHWWASNIIVIANLILFLIALLLKNLNAFPLGMLMVGIGVLACDVPRLWLKYVLKRAEEPVAPHVQATTV